MNKKILFGLIILGVIFVGSATYALFNENLLLNDVASDIQTNDTSQPNNQPNIQNNPANIQNNPLTNIMSGENSNFVPNNMANVILNGISDNSVVNDDAGQKIVKEVYRYTVDNKTLVEFDDSSFSFTVNNHTYHAKNVLTKIYDVDGVSGGYIECANCGKFIPVGNVSGLVPEDYLCDCGAYIMSIKDVPFVFSEESILESIEYDEYYKDTFGIPADNPFGAHSTNTDNIDSSDASDEVTQENVENTDSFDDYWDWLVEEELAKHRLMPNDNHPEIPEISFEID